MKRERALQKTAEEDPPYCQVNKIELNYLWMNWSVTPRNTFNLVLKPLSGN